MQVNQLEFIKIMDDILNQVNENFCLDGYAFVCSKIYNTGLKLYKDIPIYYFNAALIRDNVYLMPSPMYEDYEA